MIRFVILVSYMRADIIFPTNFSQMKGNGLFNNTITALAQMVNTQTTYKNPQHLSQRALSLGIAICSTFNRQRTLFVITQTILTLIDQIVNRQKQEKNIHIKKQSQIKLDVESHQIQIQQKSTLNNSPKCLKGNLNIAALIYQMFCPRITIWDIILKIDAVKKELERQDGIFQVVSLNHRIFQIENQTKTEPVVFKCHCQKYGSNIIRQYMLNCHHCLQEFHPSCQSNSFFCNSCFLRFCLMDLKEQLNDVFNYHKEIKVRFFGYLKNQFPPQNNPQITQSIFFNVVKFDLPGFQQQVNKRMKYVQIRIAVTDKIFPDQLQLALRPNIKTKKDVNWFWELDDVEYYFYLNHNQIQFTQNVSRNCIILKIPHKILQAQTNILIIKTVRRNQKYNYKHTNVLTYWPQKSNNTKVLMIGVYQIHKKKVSAKLRDTPALTQSSLETLRPITVYQSSDYLQYMLKQINQVPYQIVNLFNQSRLKKIQIPVRSFGCHHIECFDYAEFKQRLNPKKEKIPRKQKKPKKTSPTKDQENPIEVEQSSSEVVQVFEDEESQEKNSKKPTNIPVTKKINKNISTEIFEKRKEKQEIEPNNDLLCPICHRKLLILYEDPLFNQIIYNSGFYQKVKILNNGQYTFQGILNNQKGDDIQILN